MSAKYETVSFEECGGVGTLTLQRPAQGNAIDLPMAHELLAIAKHAAASPGLRVIVLRGAGTHFCLGGDLRASVSSGRPAADYSAEITAVLHAAILKFIELPVPVIAGVQGVAAGAGFGLALMADLVIAGRSAQWLPAYTKVSLTPDAGMSFMLPYRVGRQRSMELLLLNRKLTAEEAQSWGFVNRVVDDAAMEASIAEWAAALRNGPAQAFAETKALVRASLNGLAAQLEAESRAMARQVATPEGCAGVAAFVATLRK